MAVGRLVRERDERQHGERRLAGRGGLLPGLRVGCRGRGSARHRALAVQLVGHHRVVDVVQPLPAERPPGDVGRLLQAGPHRLRHADPAGCGQLLQPLGDADRVTVDLLVGADDLAPVDADPEAQRLRVGVPDGAGRHVGLERDREPDRLLARREQGEDAVAHGLHQPSLIVADQTTAQLSRLEDARPGPRLVARYVHAIGVHVSEEYGGVRPQSSLHPAGHAEGLYIFCWRCSMDVRTD